MGEQHIANNREFKKLFMRSEVSVIIAVLVLAVIFSAFSDNFLTSFNLFNMSRNAAGCIFIAIGQALVVIVGGMNLSLGFIGGMTVVGAGYSMQVLGLSSTAAISIGLLIGILAGFFNGLVISVLKLNSFVVTLATSFIFGGLINVVSQGNPYNDIPSGFTMIGRGGIFGVSAMMWAAILTLVVLGYFFKFTVTGRYVLATGGNVQAAKMSGVNTNKMIVLANILSGLFAAIAGLLWISKTASAQPSTGQDWMLISFAVAVIGGTALKGGVFNPIGILFAGLLIVMVKNGLVMLKTNMYYEQMYLGLILLLAVSLESIKGLFHNYKLRKELKTSSNE